jgi:hypothetical protein
MLIAPLVLLIAPLVLVLLIVTTPAMLLFDGPIIHGLVMVAAAISVAIVALRVRPGEAQFLLLLVRPIALVAAFPALWMLLQVLPLNAAGLANPIWKSAAAALGQSLAGSISIDPGASLISLAQYLSLVAIVLVATTVTIDRQRAERVLYLLTTTASLIALFVLLIRLGGFTFLNNGDGESAIDAGADIACLGVILAAATASHIFETFERSKERKPDQVGSVWSLPVFVASVFAGAVSFLAVAVVATSGAYFAVICGLGTLAIVVVIRRFRFGAWGKLTIASLALLIVVAAVVLHPGARKTDLVLAFANRASAPMIAFTQRVLTETNWAGTGAGTYAVVLPIYGDVSELTAGPMAPTAAAMIAIEMGRPFFWTILAAVIALVITFLNRALKRGRDSFYSIAGASCIVTISLLSFGNVSVLSTPVLVIASVIIGIALAQSKSRSA